MPARTAPLCTACAPSPANPLQLVLLCRNAQLGTAPMRLPKITICTYVPFCDVCTNVGRTEPQGAPEKTIQQFRVAPPCPAPQMLLPLISSCMPVRCQALLQLPRSCTGAALELHAGAVKPLPDMSGCMPVGVSRPRPTAGAMKLHRSGTGAARSCRDAVPEPRRRRREAAETPCCKRSTTEEKATKWNEVADANIRSVHMMLWSWGG
jgi:hypothetical protein